MQEGLGGIYRGYMATLYSFGPFSALYFSFYEEFKTAAVQAPHVDVIAVFSGLGLLMNVALRRQSFIISKLSTFRCPLLWRARQQEDQLLRGYLRRLI